MATTTRRADRPVNRPELKVGPFQGGIGVAVWQNEIQTEAGPKLIRSISLAPRRYKDKQTGEWKDAASYRPGDLSALILALCNAQTESTREDPLPGKRQFAHNRHVSPFEPGEMDSPTSAKHTRR